MEQLLSVLKSMPEYAALLEGLSNNESAAVTGIGQINRSHIIAGLCREAAGPVVVVCPDDMTAKRLQEELTAFLGQTPPILPSRELTLYDTSAVSRAWEQKRLRQLFDLDRGAALIQIMSYDALSLRTMPPAVLRGAAFTLEVGKEYALDSLTARLTAAGYSRCAMVEGPGQFSVRGGIVDIFSPPLTGLSGRSSSAKSWIPWAFLIPTPSAAPKMPRPWWCFPWARPSHGSIPTGQRVCAKISGA